MNTKRVTNLFKSLSNKVIETLATAGQMDAFPSLGPDHSFLLRNGIWFVGELADEVLFVLNQISDLAKTDGHWDLDSAQDEFFKCVAHVVNAPLQTRSAEVRTQVKEIERLFSLEPSAWLVEMLCCGASQDWMGIEFGKLSFHSGSMDLIRDIDPSPLVTSTVKSAVQLRREPLVVRVKVRAIDSAAAVAKARES